MDTAEQEQNAEQMGVRGKSLSRCGSEGVWEFDAEVVEAREGAVALVLAFDLGHDRLDLPLPPAVVSHALINVHFSYSSRSYRRGPQVRRRRADTGLRPSWLDRRWRGWRRGTCRPGKTESRGTIYLIQVN